MYRKVVRPVVRKGLFSLIGKIASTPDAKEILGNCLSGLLKWRPDLDFKWFSPYDEYPEIGKNEAAGDTSKRTDIIFVTGRFRSGSTLLWNIFRNMTGVTAYYEPFNERRWFDPEMRGARTDATHRRVAEYWKEYDGMPFLAEYYEEDWIRNNLYMDAGFWDPKMKRYIEMLIEHAKGRPVLQFNRVDFRLPWLRANFPNAKIVHIYRHPRDQWCSFLGKHMTSFSKDGAMDVFPDGFYLTMWCKDLKYHFPFLDPAAAGHPYELFYNLWRLSYIFGKMYADVSFSFERLLESPELVSADMCDRLDIPRMPDGVLKDIIEGPEIGKWRKYAPDEWFKQIETRCESILRNFLGHSAGGTAI